MVQVLTRRNGGFGGRSGVRKTGAASAVAVAIDQSREDITTSRHVVYLGQRGAVTGFLRARYSANPGNAIVSRNEQAISDDLSWGDDSAAQCGNRGTYGS